MLALLKRKLYSFPGYRMDFGGDSGGSAPSPDPLVGKAAQQSADLADRVYADNKEWLGELKPIIRENIATQTDAARRANEQAKIDRADYNTYGRPAIQRQAIGHGLTRYVDDATAGNLYDLYAQRNGFMKAPAASSVQSSAGSAASVAAKTGTSAAGSAGGLINYSGKLYSPNEFAGMVQGAMGSLGPNSGMVTNNGISLANALPGADEALKAAGYSFDGNGVVPINPATSPAASTVAATGTSSDLSGTTAEVRRSDGFPVQASSQNPQQLDALLKSAGIGSFAAPKYAVSFTGSDGSSVSESPESAVRSINAWRGTSNPAAKANAAAKLKALQDSGYKLITNPDGSYAFDGDPKQQYAALTKTARDTYDAQVASVAKAAGVSTPADQAANEKAIWQAENGLEKTAINTESQRAADAAGTDVTQAISKNNAMMERGMRGMVGFNPTKFARTMASPGVNLGNTALLAGGVNSARENARREVVGMSDTGTANTINTTRGLPAQAMNWTNTGTASGNSAVGNGMTAIQANNSAAAPAFQGWGLSGQLANAQYGNQLAAWNANNQNSSSGLGTALGMAKMGMDIYSGGVSSKLFPAMR